MLVLTRKPEEKIVIGKNKKIVITILKIQGDKVSIGIEADRDTPIFRDELLKNTSSDDEENDIQKVIEKVSIPIDSNTLKKDLVSKDQ